MSSTIDYIEYVCEQLEGIGQITYKKMFGEYMIYVNFKPVVLVCDNIAYLKMKEEISSLMVNSEVGIPYPGSKNHYILDIENKALSTEVVSILETITPLSKSRKKI